MSVNHWIKHPAIPVLVLLSSLITWGIITFIAEHFFFDKFYYMKSIKFGYWPPEVSMEALGNRAQDIINLKDADHQDQNRLTDSDNRFHIAVISDSYGWGRGIRDSDRYSVLLEKALNKLYPTTVLSLSWSGDSMLEHMVKYRLLTMQSYDIDLYIFGLVENDMIFQAELDRYNQAVAQSIIHDSGCNPSLVYFRNEQTDYHIDLTNSFNPQYANLCIFQSILTQLPKENAIYMDYGHAFKEEEDNPYSVFLIKPLQENNFYLLNADKVLKNIEKSKLYVSEKESHPSRLANQLFADLLYKEITQNPRWHFPSATIQ